MFHSTNCGSPLVTMTIPQTAWFGIFNPMYQIVEDYCTSTQPIEAEQVIEVAIYPNPSSGQISIQSLEPLDEIEVKDVVGRVISHSYPHLNKVSLTIEEAGVYFVTLKSGQKTITQKVIKKDW